MQRVKNRNQGLGVSKWLGTACGPLTNITNPEHLLGVCERERLDLGFVDVEVGVHVLDVVVILQFLG